MEHIRVATYAVKSGTLDEVAELAGSDDGMLGIFRRQEGFVRYGLADIGDDKLLSISLWSTRAEAERGVALAASWVKETMADRVELLTNDVGDFAFFSD